MGCAGRTDARIPGGVGTIRTRPAVAPEPAKGGRSGSFPRASRGLAVGLAGTAPLALAGSQGRLRSSRMTQNPKRLRPATGAGPLAARGRAARCEREHAARARKRSATRACRSARSSIARSRRRRRWRSSAERLPRAREGHRNRPPRDQWRALAHVALDVAVNSSSERGLLGIAVNSATPRAVFLYYTEASGGVDDNASARQPRLSLHVEPGLGSCSRARS